MTFRQDIAACFADRIGDGGLTEAEFRSVLEQTAPALDWLREQHADSRLPFLRLPEARDDLVALTRVAEAYVAGFDTVVVLGTGGSSLGGQAICALADQSFGPLAGRPRLVFLDNIDPDSFAQMVAATDPARTGLIAVSKSGGTAETMTQLLLCLEVWGDAAQDALTAVAEPGDNPLRALAARHGIPVLDHDPNLGGRYSALSVTGALPALIAGLDAVALREGAADALGPVLAAAAPADVPAAAGAALHVALARHKGVGTAVLMAYVDRLRHFADWFRQLWAESLGKDGQGTTPVPALGAVDQHSQLQLYLDGPPDKFYTLVLLHRAGTGRRVDPELADDPRLAYLAGRTMGDLMEAEQRATAETLIKNGRPVRVLRLAQLDERALGAMMMHFMLETVIAGRLLGVDPFDQPAVEEGKVLAREYLAAMASEETAGS
ncbi:MAG: glucose-6-phosphate isomerase [Alphaproteobacteria bacterium]|nr:glucose-6-phosphate isomerase [Alphaproteobacteria bacterium]